MKKNSIDKMHQVNNSNNNNNAVFTRYGQKTTKANYNLKIALKERKVTKGKSGDLAARSSVMTSFL